MANTDAVSAVCKAVVHILTTAMAEQIDELGLTGVKPTFGVFSSTDFAQKGNDKITSGASVYLYRALPNLSHRTPAGRLRPDGRRHFNKLPLDLHILITIWGVDAGVQNQLVGWVMRTLEDYPIIPATVLNIGVNTPVFAEDEGVEWVLSEMNGEELLQLWDVLGNGEIVYQISIPYVARNIFVDSRRISEIGEPVQVRTADMQRYNGGGR